MGIEYQVNYGELDIISSFDMDFSLMEIGSTLALGAFFCGGIWLLAFICLPSVQFSGITNDSKTAFKAVLQVIMAALMFSMGIFLEDMSDTLVEDENWSRHRKAMISVSNEEEIRRAALESMGSQFLDLILVHKDLTPVFDCKDTNDITTCKTDLAYKVAKNRVYKNQQYSRELIPLEDRIRFSRGFSLGTFILFGFIALAIIGFLASMIYSGSFKRHKVERAILLFVTIIIFITVHLSARYSYKSEETAHTKRVFGYYMELK